MTGSRLIPSSLPPARRGAFLAVLALLLVAVAGFFAFVFPQTPGRMGRASAGLIDDLAIWRVTADLLPSPDSRVAVTVAVPLAAVLFFAVYALALALVWRWDASRRALLGLGVVAVVVLGIGVFAYPNVNTDIYSYIASGRVAAVHGANPYYHPPSAFPADPLYPYVSEQYSDNLPSKLPAFMLLNESLAEAAGNDPVTNLLAYRSAFFLLGVASLVLVVLTARRLFPGSEAAGLVLLGWNPVFAVYGQSKTDIVMVFLLLCAAYLYARARPRLGIAALGLSSLVKLITVPLVVVTLARDVQLRRWRELAIGLAVLAALVALVYLPFAHGLGLLRDHLGLLGAVESAEGVNRTGEAGAERLLRLLLAAGFVALLVVLARAQDGSPRKLIRAWAIAGLYFAVFLTTPALAWYQLVPLALAAVSGSAAITVAIVALSFASFLFGSWYAASSSDFPLGNLFGIPPALLYLLPVVFGAVALLVLRGDLLRLRRPGQARRLAR